jgi:hypothetical protein
VFAFCVERIVNDKFAFEDFMIAQSECAEATRDPAQSFSSWMRIAWVRISRPNDFAE